MLFYDTTMELSCFLSEFCEFFLLCVAGYEYQQKLETKLMFTPLAVENQVRPSIFLTRENPMEDV